MKVLPASIALLILSQVLAIPVHAAEQRRSGLGTSDVPWISDALFRE